MVSTTLTNESSTGNSTGYTVDKAIEQMKITYSDLMKIGYKVNEIDQMDIHWLFEMCKNGNKNKRVSIEGVL